MSLNLLGCHGASARLYGSTEELCGDSVCRDGEAAFSNKRSTPTDYQKNEGWIKAGTNYAGLENINFLLLRDGLLGFIEIYQAKYLNNLVAGSPLHQKNYKTDKSL